MTSKAPIPDAWDDDWVNTADTQEPKTIQPEIIPKLSKAERRAHHLVQQKEIWDAAENPGRKMWLEAQGVEVPLQQSFTQPVQLLSRKPPVIAKKSAVDGLGQLSLGDEEDSEEERRKRQVADLEERQRKAKVEREDKQRRYAEARERIMGSSKSTPVSNSRDNSQGRDNRRPRANKAHNPRRSQPDSPAEQSPARGANRDRQLFDPEDMSRSSTPRREAGNVPNEDQPLRQPRGPSNSGRGGFGFAARGEKAGA